MKTIQLSIIAAVTTLALVAGNAFASTAFPPPGSITRTFTITNNTPNAINWHYNKDGDECSASSTIGNIASQNSIGVKVTCPYTASGEFDFSLGSVYAGYGPCYVISGNNISASGGSSCQINLN